MITWREYDYASESWVVRRAIPLWVARQKEALGALRERRAHDYEATCSWFPLADRVVELEARIRELEGEPKCAALPSAAEWAARQARLDAEGDAPFTDNTDERAVAA